MKKLFLLLILSLPLIAFAQEKEPTQYIAKYHYSLSPDANNPAYVYKEDMMLLIGKRSSLFKSYEAYQKDSLVAAQQTINMNVFSSPRQYMDDEILTIYNNEKGYLSKKLGLRYFWETEIPKYDWKILPDKMKIAGYDCQKAEMYSPKTQRSYTAWFTSQIPVPAGPAYINGLPGLIVKFEDSAKLVRMELFSFQKNVRGHELISFGNKAVKTTKASFDKATLAYKKDPMGFMKNTGAIGGSVDAIKKEKN